MRRSYPLSDSPPNLAGGQESEGGGPGDAPWRRREGAAARSDGGRRGWPGGAWERAGHAM